MSIKTLQEYTRFSKYAKYVPEKKRRESWEEQVTRVFEMHYEKLGPEISEALKEDLEFAKKMVLKKRVLGSQRALQFGGKPILDKNARIYNCTVSYCDRVRFFQEGMYLLLCGCGIGFSVQKQHTDLLPGLRLPNERDKKTFVIEDSIEGWADSIGVLLSSFFIGNNTTFPEYENATVTFDYSKIRPAGAPISSGSKAPGPDGLRSSMIKIDKLLRKCCKFGNRLRSIDAYDIMMHASDAVLSGGVRRSATICLFSSDDEEMANAKTGSWFIDEPQRGRSNNSVLLIRDETSKEDFGKFMGKIKEFGEPGFVWAEHRDVVYNPCVSKDTWIMTEEGPRQAKDLIGKQFGAVVDGNVYKTTEKGVFQTGTKELFTLETKEGITLEATSNHQIMTTKGWVELDELNYGDELVLHNHQNVKWDGSGSFDEGWLLGSLVGDGTFSKNSAQLDYWGESRFHMVDLAIEKIYNCGLQTYKKITGGKQKAKVGKQRVYSAGLGRLADSYGIVKNEKTISELIEKGSSDMHSGFLQGYFDADGSVQGDLKKGVSIRLSSINLANLKVVQRMLLRLGIVSTVYQNRREAGLRMMPNGKGGEKEYYCQASHELVISNDSIMTYHSRVGFSEPEKIQRLNEIISSYKRKPNKSKFIVTVENIESKGVEKVYDCTVPIVHAFDANGIYVHNCVEIGMVPKLPLTDELRERFADEVALQENNEFLSGWEFCNLCEINVKKAKTEGDFMDACRAAAILGTIQASYSSFEYLGGVSEEIVKMEALLGVSMTGMADNPDVAFNPSSQRKGAKLILAINERISKVIGINKCARATCIKPAGSTSCVLGTASGIHPHHAKRYFRRVQANKQETPLQYFAERNPDAVEESVWSNNKTDMIITFLCEVPDGAKTKNQVSAITLLESVKLTQQNWVEYGTRHDTAVYPWLRHNVSNTINVKPDEWEEVEAHIYKNKKWYAGISMIPMSGDKDYPQAPFTAVMTPTEMVREHGDACMFASGLIVDGLRAFEDNLWAASDCVLDIGEIITVEALRLKIKADFVTNGVKWKKEGLSPDSPRKLLHAWLKHNVINYEDKVDWVRRAKQFAERYFDGDDRKMTYCLKDVTNWKKWCDLSRTYVDVDWSGCYEDEYGSLESFGGGAGEACQGGACELGDLGYSMRDKLRKD